VTFNEALVLSVILRLGRAYGHEVSKEVQGITERPIGVGTLYKTLHNLEADGYLSAQWEEEQPAEEYGRPRRRYYSPTGLASTALDEYIRMHTRLVEAWTT
jgi:DNA-binding PadR family transcriptional regulator